MIEHTIPEAERKDYFDLISKSAHGQEIELEIIGLDIGDQVEKDWVAFEGISYDPEAKTLHLYTDSLEHQIPNPSEIIAAEENSLVTSLFVKDSLGHFQIIKFRNAVQSVEQH